MVVVLLCPDHSIHCGLTNLMDTWGQLDPCVVDTILVVGAKTDPSSSIVAMDDSPKSINFGILKRIVSLTKFIRLRA